MLRVGRSKGETKGEEERILGNLRVRCLACATEQEVPDSGPGACEICGTPLPGSRGDLGDEVSLVDSGRPGAFADEEVGAPPTPPSFADLLAAPTGAAGKELDELVEQEKRVVTILSFVPLWGPWYLWQSELHGEDEKLRWGAASLALTAAILIAIVSLLPGAAERTAAARSRIEEDVAELASLIETFRRNAGLYPDDEAWQRSVERGDPRFFDPWNRPYAYRLEPDAYVLTTLGRDGAPGGTGEDADVSRTMPLSADTAEEDEDVPEHEPAPPPEGVAEGDEAG
jgi:hypothetical protein